jgi:hypothetical protein
MFGQRVGQRCLILGWASGIGYGEIRPWVRFYLRRALLVPAKGLALAQGAMFFNNFRTLGGTGRVMPALEPQSQKGGSRHTVLKES